MNRVKALFMTLLAIFSGCFCQNCELDLVKGCLKYPDNTIQGIENNPYNLVLWNEIKTLYCMDDSLNNCKTLLDSVPGCEAEDKAPYDMLIRTAEVVCHTGIDPATTCLKSLPVQNEFAKCFYVLQKNTQYLDFKGHSDALCSSYEAANTCVHATQENFCSSKNSKTLIQKLLSATLDPWTEPLGCPNYMYIYD